VARINLKATIDQVDFAAPVWEWLDLLGEMLVLTQGEGLAHEGYIADDPFKKLMVFGVNRMIGTMNSIYILLRCEHIDHAASHVRLLCEALITLSCSGQVKTDNQLSRFLEIPVLLFKLSGGKVSQIGMKAVAVIKHLDILDDVSTGFVAY
jgi:hypothetical protein